MIENFFKDYIKDNNIIKINVKVNKDNTKITDFDKENNLFILNIKSIPEKGKANLEIIKYFKKQFNLNIKIISGLTSRKKILKII